MRMGKLDSHDRPQGSTPLSSLHKSRNRRQHTNSRQSWLESRLPRRWYQCKASVARPTEQYLPLRHLQLCCDNSLLTGFTANGEETEYLTNLPATKIPVQFSMLFEKHRIPFASCNAKTSPDAIPEPSSCHLCVLESSRPTPLSVVAVSLSCRS